MNKFHFSHLHFFLYLYQLHLSILCHLVSFDDTCYVMSQIKDLRTKAYYAFSYLKIHQGLKLPKALPRKKHRSISCDQNVKVKSN